MPYHDVSGDLYCPEGGETFAEGVEAIAAPRHISSDCGICIRFDRSDENRARLLMVRADIEIAGVYNE